MPSKRYVKFKTLHRRHRGNHTRARTCTHHTRTHNIYIYIYIDIYIYIIYIYIYIYIIVMYVKLLVCIIYLFILIWIDSTWFLFNVNLFIYSATQWINRKTVYIIKRSPWSPWVPGDAQGHQLYHVYPVTSNSMLTITESLSLKS